MPNFLSDPSVVLYAILSIIALVTGVRAARTQRLREGVPFFVSLALVIGLFLCDHFFESPRETASRKIAEMGLATRSKNRTDFLKHVSDSFAHKKMDKKGLGVLSDRLNSYDVKGIECWEASKANFKEVNETTVEQGFLVQPVGNPQFIHYCVGTFRKEADGEWRLTGFKLYDALQRTNGGEKDVPGF